ncbi:MAG: hypothetical protein OCU20_06230, partial [Methanophagales archaeon]|nr:hypothetical protein [Methanophagales archaeon]
PKKQHCFSQLFLESGAFGTTVYIKTITESCVSINSKVIAQYQVVSGSQEQKSKILTRGKTQK